MSRRACGGAPFARRKIKSMANRYALRMDDADSWTVFDIFTGQPAEFEQKIMAGINARRAEKMVMKLNTQDARRRDEADRAS